MEKGLQYFAFISYSHQDKKEAKWLQNHLQNYLMPAKLRKVNKALPKRIKPVFRDLTHLFPKQNDLGELLKQELDISQNLIVICSPNSAKSRYVGEEIKYFKSKYPERKIIPYIISGEAYSKDLNNECYNVELLDGERLGISIDSEESRFRILRRRRAYIRLIASLFDLEEILIWGLYKSKLIKRTIIGFIISLAILVCLGAFWNYNKPFNLSVLLTEGTVHNPNLPFKDGKIKLIYDDTKAIIKVINNYSDRPVFTDIPGKYKDKHIRIIFEMFGFETIDTTLCAKSAINLNIKRDETWGRFYGYVIDEQMNPVADAVVSVDCRNTKTNDCGFFDLCIPVEEQEKTKLLVVKKKNYIDWSYESEPSKDFERKILLERL